MVVEFIWKNKVDLNYIYMIFTNKYILYQTSSTS